MPIPFPLAEDEINHFWRNHKIKKNLDDKRIIRIPVLFKFEDFETHTVTVYYKDKVATITQYDYEDWFATWWATWGTWEIRKRLDLNLFDRIPEEEYPIIEEIKTPDNGNKRGIIRSCISYLQKISGRKRT